MVTRFVDDLPDGNPLTGLPIEPIKTYSKTTQLYETCKALLATYQIVVKCTQSAYEQPRSHIMKPTKFYRTGQTLSTNVEQPQNHDQTLLIL